MGKSLIIKGADFSKNALCKISIDSDGGVSGDIPSGMDFVYRRLLATAGKPIAVFHSGSTLYFPLYSTSSGTASYKVFSIFRVDKHIGKTITVTASTYCNKNNSKQCAFFSSTAEQAIRELSTIEENKIYASNGSEIGMLSSFNASKEDFVENTIEIVVPDNAKWLVISDNTETGAKIKEINAFETNNIEDIM